ncbi:oxygenase MpaB family protein [Actinophytocola sp.]|uniref:oxygenase MpaB family protein n=1 Tax=Actinophytocola sp. TaxID=1872138 RepID=UPI002D805871|nr:oxygenase MpaB family protein [Actinophytocola sp.]HET9142432.1 oxygenase MpaB family protein [Actinophytocola sp.]
MRSASPAERLDQEPDHGLFGPDSVTWQVHGDPAMWVAGIRSLYLQALHPLAVAAVVQNSDFQSDPLGRLIRTADFVGVSTYGTREEVERASARVRRVHRSLRARDPDTGQPFPIDRPDLLLWVHCAEVASFLSVVARSGFPLRRAHADRYLDEQRATAALVGLDPAGVPGSVAEMSDYFRDIRPSLRRTGDSDTIYDFLHRPPVPGLLGLGVRVYEPVIGHLAYSLLPRWALRLYGRRAYPSGAATVALRAARRAALSIPGGVRIGRREPHPVTAARRLGAWSMPSPKRLPAL